MEKEYDLECYQTIYAKEKGATAELAAKHTCYVFNAFAGLGNVKNAYQYAIAKKNFSCDDAILVSP